MFSMTGSPFYQRQHSSTGVDLKKKKTMRLKYRRSLSADEQNLLEFVNKEKLSKKDTVSSDDSGIEDSDQQVVNLPTNQINEKEETCATFEACADEEEDEDEINNSTPTNTPIHFDDVQENPQRLINDLDLSARIKNEEKKEFCENTSQVFHAEFARLISFPLAINYNNVHYYLFVEDGVCGDPCQWPYYAYMKLDNAKAQFECPNPVCRHLWTSMRARISFKISYPCPQGFVVLKIFGQSCIRCKTPADARWYIEEVCRVMENLSQSIYKELFHLTIDHHDSQNGNIIASGNQYFQRSRHDPHQRAGKMRAPHDAAHCEACQFGLCFQ